MKTYLDALKYVIENGVDKIDRTGTGTRSVFGYQMRFPLQSAAIPYDDDWLQGIHWPLVTTKKLHWKSILVELVWFLQGRTDIKFLHDNKVKIWDAWVREDGDFGPIYGKQWRDFFGVDQIKEVYEGLRDNPFGRRHIVSAWNPAELEDMALPPCHCFFQFNVRPKGNHKILDLQLYQRSADIFLGVPYNIASYSALLLMFANRLGYTPGDYVHTFGDLHLYSNHFEQAVIQINRKPRNSPILYFQLGDFDPSFNVYPTDITNFMLKDYNHHPLIKGDISV